MSLVTLAGEHGTPTYVYSASSIVENFRAYTQALASVDHRVCFAVKANSNLAVLSLLAREGAGFDIVSGGELHRVLAAGGAANSVVFSGVGKTEQEIRFALSQRIHSFNCESEPEIELIDRVAQELGVIAAIAVRVNPDVDAVTHPYISTGLREHKFGLDIADAAAVYRRARQMRGIHVIGVSCHIGSQLLSVQPILEAADKVLALAAELRSAGHRITELDLGGGLGVPYRLGDQPVSIAEFAGQLAQRVQGTGLRLLLEPGRSIVGEAGVLLSRVSLIKQNGAKTFIILDAGMNDLIRPSLYQAHHELTPVCQGTTQQTMTADIVGPVCETGDFFAREREIAVLAPGDLVAIRTAGAYGFVLSSNYNSRPRACELLIDGSGVHVARRRETFDDLLRGEAALDSAILDRTHF